MKPGMWSLFGPEKQFIEYLWPHEVFEITRTFRCVVDATSKRVEMI